MNQSRIVVVERDLERLIKQRFGKKIQNQKLEFIFASNVQKAVEKLQLYSFKNFQVQRLIASQFSDLQTWSN